MGHASTPADSAPSPPFCELSALSVRLGSRSVKRNLRVGAVSLEGSDRPEIGFSSPLALLPCTSDVEQRISRG
jgi:hypothetical protein